MQLLTAGSLLLVAVFPPIIIVTVILCLLLLIWPSSEANNYESGMSINDIYDSMTEEEYHNYQSRLKKRKRKEFVFESFVLTLVDILSIVLKIVYLILAFIVMPILSYKTFQAYLVGETLPIKIDFFNVEELTFPIALFITTLLQITFFMYLLAKRELNKK